MRILHLTDAHIYAAPTARFDGVDTRASLKRTLAAAAAIADVDALVLGGDNSMDGSAASYRWLATSLSHQSLVPWMIPGNHDQPAAAAADQFIATPTALVAGSWCVLLLDSRIAGESHGRLGAATLSWLATTLAQHRARHVAIFLHHHPLAIDCAWMDPMMLDDAAAFWSVIETHANPRLVVCGHVHQNRDLYRGDVRVLMTPSSCVQFLPHSEHYATDPRAPGFRVIDLLADGSIDTRVVRVAKS